MKVVIINKSDARGGAAVVSHRLMRALRGAGVDAQMLVEEKLTDDEHVHVASPGWRAKVPFLEERLDIYLHNGRNRADLFKVDTGKYGLPLSRHRLVKGADVVCLGWVNQGMLSLREIGRIAAKKPVVWTMHDLWCATGVCHHPGTCEGFLGECGVCPLLHGSAGPYDLSHRVWKNKSSLYAARKIAFVAVSRWLEGRCRESALMRDARIEVIGNPVEVDSSVCGACVRQRGEHEERVELLMVAARLDDTIKGLPVLVEALHKLAERNADLAARMRLTMVGELRDASLVEGLPVEVRLTGSLPQKEVAELYRSADVLVSPSYYETLPGTLVEAQMYGAVPVAFDSGGQRDIVEPGVTGILIEKGGDFAAGIEAAVALSREPGIAARMLASVQEHFSADEVARRYLRLMQGLIGK